MVLWVKREDKAGSCFLKVVYKALKTKGKKCRMKTENKRIKRKMRKASFLKKL